MHKMVVEQAAAVVVSVGSAQSGKIGLLRNSALNTADATSCGDKTDFTRTTINI
jgi:hypothetical protein